MTSSSLGKVRTGVAWLFILGVAAILTIAVLVPRVAGATPYTVLSSSMEPDLPPGTLVVVRPVDPESLGVGSVVTYQLASGEAEFVTHRVVTQTLDSEGEPLFRTQGDANDEADKQWVRPVQVKGELWYSVPYLGYLNNLLTGKERQWAVYGAAALLLGYAALMWASAIRDRRRRDDRETVTGGRHATAA